MRQTHHISTCVTRTTLGRGLLCLLFSLFLQTPISAQQGTTFNPFTGNMDYCVNIRDESSNVNNLICGPLIFDDGMLTDNADGTFSFSSVTTVPTTQTDSCSAGQYAANTDYFYICYSDNNWRRVALSTFADNTFYILLDDGTSKILLDDGSSAIIGR